MRRRNPSSHRLSYLTTRQGFPGTMSDDEFLELYDNAMIDVENSAQFATPDGGLLENAVALLIEMKNRPHLRTDSDGMISQETRNDIDRRQDLDAMLSDLQNPRHRRLKRHY